LSLGFVCFSYLISLFVQTTFLNGFLRNYSCSYPSIPKNGLLTSPLNNILTKILEPQICEHCPMVLGFSKLQKISSVPFWFFFFFRWQVLLSIGCFHIWNFLGLSASLTFQKFQQGMFCMCLMCLVFVNLAKHSKNSFDINTQVFLWVTKFFLLLLYWFYSICSFPFFWNKCSDAWSPSLGILPLTLWHIISILLCFCSTLQDNSSIWSVGWVLLWSSNIYSTFHSLYSILNWEFL
jgi:hypothetical protein